MKDKNNFLRFNDEKKEIHIKGHIDNLVCGGISTITHLFGNRKLQGAIHNLISWDTPEQKLTFYTKDDYYFYKHWLNHLKEISEKGDNND